MWNRPNCNLIVGPLAFVAAGFLAQSELLAAPTVDAAPAVYQTESQEATVQLAAHRRSYGFRRRGFSRPRFSFSLGYGGGYGYRRHYGIGGRFYRRGFRRPFYSYGYGYSRPYPRAYSYGPRYYSDYYRPYYTYAPAYWTYSPRYADYSARPYTSYSISVGTYGYPYYRDAYWGIPRCAW